jgi:hypothetical protein
MKFLCLAYGAEKDWIALSQSEQRALLAQDDVLRSRGDSVNAVDPESTVVKAWDGSPSISHEPFAASAVPLAGFAVIEADSVEEVVALVANTPCARAKGAIEIRHIMGS